MYTIPRDRITSETHSDSLKVIMVLSEDSLFARIAHSIATSIELTFYDRYYYLFLSFNYEILIKSYNFFISAHKRVLLSARTTSKPIVFLLVLHMRPNILVFEKRNTYSLLMTGQTNGRQ